MSAAPPAARLGGRIRHEPEDFLVEELPLVAPTGTGDHVLAQVEKRGITTFDLLLFLSKALHTSERSIGYAGLKDARAVTRQWVSLPRVDPARVAALAGPAFHVLSAACHPHGLKIGHLKGNRFTIRIRDVDLAHEAAARRALEHMAAHGMPNPYGGQRFGTKGDGHLLGRALVTHDHAGFLDTLLGQPSPLEQDVRVQGARVAWERGAPEEALELWPRRRRSEKRALSAWLRTHDATAACEAVPPAARRLWVSAWQSWVFNRVLERRRAEGTWDEVLAGDIAWLTDSGACLPATGDARDRQRAAALLASPTGPLPGYDLHLAQGAPGRLEQEVLAAEGVDPEALREGLGRMRGSRRPLRVPVREASLEVEPSGSVLVRFVLPPGAFATVLLAQLMDGDTTGAQAAPVPRPAAGEGSTPRAIQAGEASLLEPDGTPEELGPAGQAGEAWADEAGDEADDGA